MTRRPPSTIPLIDVYSQTFASLNGKTVVVTGGSSGIGLECGKLFNSLGADVVLGDVQPPRGEAASWISQSARVKYIPCDITDWESLSNFFEAAKSISGRIHVVCANAGINEMGDAFRPLERDERLRAPDLRTLNVNLGGAILTVSCAFQHLAAGGGGSIVMTSSMAGYLGVPEMPIYAATKHGIVGLMRSLKTRSLANNIAISLVAPGMTPTPIMASLPNVDMPDGYSDDALATLYDHIRGSGVPANRTETVARAIVYQADAGLSANGQGLMVLGDQVCELEEALLEAWPQWLLDTTDFIRSAPSTGIYDPTKKA